MPVEIRELHIRVNVNEQANNPPGSTNTGGGASEEQSKKEDALVAECIEQTLKVLKNQKER